MAGFLQKAMKPKLCPPNKWILKSFNGCAAHVKAMGVFIFEKIQLKFCSQIYLSVNRTLFDILTNTVSWILN